MWVVVGPRATATAVRRSAAVEADVITSLRLAGGTFSWGTLFAAPYCGVEVRVQQDPPGRPGRSPFEVFEPHHASTASSSTKAPSNSAPTSLSSASMQTHTEVSCNPPPRPATKNIAPHNDQVQCWTAGGAVTAILPNHTKLGMLHDGEHTRSRRHAVEVGGDPQHRRCRHWLRVQ